MFLYYEVFCTVIAVVGFLVLLFMEPPYTRHTFVVENNAKYPDKYAFAPSSLSKASFFLANEILIDSFTKNEFSQGSSFNTIVPSIALASQVGFFSELCVGDCSTLAKNILFEDWQEQDFYLELEKIKSRFEGVTKGAEKLKLFNLFFRSKKIKFSKEDLQRLDSRYSLGFFDLEDRGDSTLPAFINQVASDYSNKITGFLKLSEKPEPTVVSYLDLHLKMPEGFFRFLGSKYQFNNMGMPSKKVVVPFQIHNNISARYLRQSNGNELFEIPVKDGEISLLIKQYKREVNKECPLCHEVIELQHYQLLMQEERKYCKIALPEFEIRDSLELSTKLASIMKSFESKGSSYLHFKHQIPVYGGSKNFGEISRNDPAKIIKGTVFSSSENFMIQGNEQKSFRIANSIHYSSLKVNSEFVTNHRSQNTPEVDVSKDTDSAENTHVIDYPFYFYLVDVRNKIVLVAGKIVEL